MKRYIGHPRVEGKASRQAHADLPPGTYEREMSKEGFFGPAAFFHHRHPPTAWSAFEGPLSPHAFDFTKLDAVTADPWAAPDLLSNASVRIRFWRVSGKMDALARNADGGQDDDRPRQVRDRRAGGEHFLRAVLVLRGTDVGPRRVLQHRCREHATGYAEPTVQ